MIESYNIDESGYYTYLVLNGREADFDAAKQIAQEAGFWIDRSGASFRPAADGIQYDWYIRLGVGPDPKEKCLKELEKALNKIADNSKALPDADNSYSDEQSQESKDGQIKTVPDIQNDRDALLLAEEYATEVDTLKEENRELQDRLEDSEYKADKSEEKIISLQKQLRNESSNLATFLSKVYPKLKCSIFGGCPDNNTLSNINAKFLFPLALGKLDLHELRKIYPKNNQVVKNAPQGWYEFRQQHWRIYVMRQEDNDKYVCVLAVKQDQEQVIKRLQNLGD